MEAIFSRPRLRGIGAKQVPEPLGKNVIWAPGLRRGTYSRLGLRDIGIALQQAANHCVVAKMVGAASGFSSFSIHVLPARCISSQGMSTGAASKPCAVSHSGVRRDLHRPHSVKIKIPSGPGQYLGEEGSSSSCKHKCCRSTSWDLCGANTSTALGCTLTWNYGTSQGVKWVDTREPSGRGVADKKNKVPHPKGSWIKKSSEIEKINLKLIFFKNQSKIQSGKVLESNRKINIFCLFCFKT